MKAQEIYDALKAAYPQYADRKVCDVYKPCASPHARQCADVASTLMLDFDRISDAHDIDKYYTDCHHLDSVMAGL